MYLQLTSRELHTPLTVGDKEIKAAIEELLEERTAEGELIFRNKKQWWAVFRVLNVFCQYPSQMSAFDSKMKELEVAKVDGNRDLTYDSLSKAPRDVPKMAVCLPSAWSSYRDLNDNYKQQYDVAEFLMLKLGMKS